MSTSQAHLVFTLLICWLLIVTGCRTTDQYGCTPRQNRLATKAYYKGMSKCPGRFDLLYRSDHPIHDSSYTETVYLPGQTITSTDTLVQLDTMLVDGYYYITRTINRHTFSYKTDTARQTQYNTRTITVTNPAPQQASKWWLWAWAIFSSLIAAVAIYLLVLALRGKR